MSPGLWISHVLLWVAVAALAALVLALVRQIGVLNERLRPAGALMGAAGPSVGERAEPVAVLDWDGVARTVGGIHPLGDDTLLFFVSPTCPVCKVLLPVVSSMRRSEGPRLDVVIASDGAREEHEAFVATHRLDREGYVLSTELGVRYQVGRLPYAVLLDGEGRVRARGLVNTREHLESLFEARDRGVASIQEFVAVSQVSGGQG